MKKFIQILPVIFVTGCANDTLSVNNVCAEVLCLPIYGREKDWEVISDDLVRNIYRHNRMCAEMKNSISKP